MNCPDCGHRIREHAAYGCQHVYWDWSHEDRCQCASDRESVQESIDILERETVIEQRVKDMERGMYDDILTI